MKIILLGAPGSGKGTQSKRIEEKYGLAHISTGDIFRKHLKEGTELGKKVQAVMESGRLCPDDLTIELVKERLSQPDCKNGYLLDGFPRNLFQAKALDEFCAPDKVLNLVIPFEVVIERISLRRHCAKCGASHNLAFLGGKNVCPDCGGELLMRKDDSPETVKERLKVYTAQTEPLIEYYEKQGKLVNVDMVKDCTDPDADERDLIFADIVKVLEK